MRGSLAEAERERDEALQQKRDVGESAKAGQRESAARIVEFSQKNAKLLADVTQLRGGGCIGVEVKRLTGACVGSAQGLNVS